MALIPELIWMVLLKHLHPCTEAACALDWLALVYTSFLHCFLSSNSGPDLGLLPSTAKRHKGFSSKDGTTLDLSASHPFLLSENLQHQLASYRSKRGNQEGLNEATKYEPLGATQVLDTYSTHHSVYKNVFDSSVY